MRNDEFSNLVLKIEYEVFNQHLVCARQGCGDAQGKIPLLRSLPTRRERRNLKKKKKIKGQRSLEGWLLWCVSQASLAEGLVPGVLLAGGLHSF